MSVKSSTAGGSSARAWLIGILVVALLGGGGYLGWRLWKGKPNGSEEPQKSDLTAAMKANLRGVGYMDRMLPGAEGTKGFIEQAIEAFEEAIELAPDWPPAQINLAIALLNTNGASKEVLDRSRKILESVLEKEPQNPHAHYCLAILDYFGDQDSAYAHLEAVEKVDPNDPHTWFYKGLTHPKGTRSQEAKDCFERALKLDPYLVGARYQLALHPIGKTPEGTKRQMDEKEALEKAKWRTLAAIEYTKMGRYAGVIGRFPSQEAVQIGPAAMFTPWDVFQAKLPAETKWARPADFGTGATADLQRAVRARFGATMIAFDFNGDGRPDLFLCSAVTRDGKIGDLLLRNDGNGTFTDVTAEAGLANGWSLGCSTADYDNDGRPDLVLTGVGAPRLFRNLGLGRFENVSTAATLDAKDLSGVFLGAAWIDIDQDGDLDLVLARYADSVDAALAQLQGKGGTGGGFMLMLNIGEARPAAGNELLELTTRFKRWEAPESLKLSGATIGSAVGDLDGDRDVDLLLLADGQKMQAVWNDRLLRFHNAGEIGDTANWNGAILLDVNHDQRSDVLALPTGKPPVLWLSRASPGAEKLADHFVSGATNSPALLQAHAVDLDRDGWTDVVGVSADHRPVFLQNDGLGKLLLQSSAFGLAENLPNDVQAALAVDLDGDGNPELVMLPEGKGLLVLRNGRNGNRTLRIDLAGTRNSQAEWRTNADGLGAWISAQTGSLWTGQERIPLQAGLGKSLLPVELGLGKNHACDFVRITWPDGVPQVELTLAAGSVRIPETDRRPTSCPILFVWDGTRYRYVTDILGAGSMGESNPDGSTRLPRPEESIKIEPGIMAAKDGYFRIKIAEPMDEVMYLDRLELVAVDHPAGWSVYPDERFVVNGPQPTQELLFLTDMRPVARGRDHRGRDVTAVLRERDRKMVDGFKRRSWIGFAEEHFVELDFDRSTTPGGKDDRWILCLHGWTDYPFPELIWAANQAGIDLLPPMLETPTADGKWRTRGELGFPAGLPRTMTRDVSELFGTPVTDAPGSSRFRIRTNMQVFWDQIELGRQIAAVEVQKNAKIVAMPVGQATLRWRGLAKETSPDGSRPVIYDDQRTEPVPVTEWKGRLTRFGDVTELLTKQDDRFVICGPGEEIEIGFDAGELPPVAPGQARSFVLRAAGYSKDTGPFTATGGNIGPLPYRAMPTYPPPKPPKEIERRLEEYDREWNTRSRK